MTSTPQNIYRNEKKKKVSPIYKTREERSVYQIKDFLFFFTLSRTVAYQDERLIPADKRLLSYR